MPITTLQPVAHANLYHQMPCHVFAISGNTLNMDSINNKYQQLGQYLIGEVPAPAKPLKDRIANIMDEFGYEQRVATMALIRDEFGLEPGNRTNIRLWGFFPDDLQMLPEHMWITKGTVIYDTMPGAPIRRDRSLSGANPPSETNQLPVIDIYSVEVAELHSEQLDIINSLNWG